jgi:hypothetical protein
MPLHTYTGAERAKELVAQAVVTLPDIASCYDLVVYGATPAGIVCAVRAAREGLDVLLVEHSVHVGGLMSSGLSVMDTLYAGARSPLYDELRREIHDYYRINYGPDSSQFAASRPGHPKTYYEAHVVEYLFLQMIKKEPGITLVKGFYPVDAARNGASVQKVEFKEKHGPRSFTAVARVFADCSYEADLAVASGADYRIGREARSEYDEEYAGRIFLRRVTPWPPEHVDPAVIAKYKELNLFHYDRWFEIMRDISTGEADKNVQAYNIRAILTTDPANRIIEVDPPGNYNAEEMREIWNLKPQYSQLLGPLPNQKFLWNMPELLGPQHAYPDGDWAARERIIEQHRQATRGMLFFLQNDPSLPDEVRRQWRNLGFARDEFTDNGNLPHEVYARETRRVMGRRVFTEHDVRLEKDLHRAPIHADSIGVTEWFLDSHASGAERKDGSIFEGEVYLNYVSHPAQIPYRALLPKGLDNLLVPVCLSSSHIGWGAIRLEPTWMSIAESSAYAAILAVTGNIMPADIESDSLVRLLAERRVMISFFNDVPVDAREPWVAAVQYLGTQGFFATYDARPNSMLTMPEGMAWARAAVEWISGKKIKASERARDMMSAENAKGNILTVDEFCNMVYQEMKAAARPCRMDVLRVLLPLPGKRPISRGNACRLVFALGNRHPEQATHNTQACSQ